MSKRIYLVKMNGTEKLIRAVSVTQAIAHVAKTTIDGGLAKQEDLLRLAATVQVEDAGANPGISEATNCTAINNPNVGYTTGPGKDTSQESA